MIELQAPLLGNRGLGGFAGLASSSLFNNAIETTKEKYFSYKEPEQVENYMTEVRSMIGDVERFVEENTQSVLQLPFKINAFALTKDSKHLIYVTTNGKVALFSIRKKIIKNDFPLSDKSLFAILLTKDEKHILATGQGGIINVFKYPSLEHVKSMEGHEGSVIRLIQTPDGKTMFSCGEDSTVRRWDLTDFSGGEVLMKHEGQSKSITLDPTCRYLFSGGEDKLIRVYDLESQSEIKQLSGHANWVWALATSPDSKYLASGGSDNTVILWDLATLEQIKTLSGHSKRLAALQFSPDSNFLVSASTDTTLRIWPLKSRAAPRILTGHTNWVKACMITPDQKYIYSAGEDGTFRIWSFPADIVDEELTIHNECIRSISVGNLGGTLITGSEDCTVKLWSIKKNAFVRDIANLDSKVSCGTIANDDSLCALATEDGSLYIIETKSYTILRSAKVHDCAIKSVAIDDSRKLIMTGGSSDARVCVLDIETLKPKKIIRGHSNWIWSVAFSHDSQYAITGSSDCTVKIWDIETRKCLSTLTAHDERINNIAITKNSEILVTGDQNGKVYIWSFFERRHETVLDVHDSAITGVYITSDGRTLFTSDLNGKLNIFDLETRQTITSLSLGGINYFTLDPQELNIYYSNGSNSYFIKNPLKVRQLSVFGNGNKSEYISYLHSIMIQKKYIDQNLDFDSWIIMPYKINLLHIYAYYGLTDYIKKSIENKFNLLRSAAYETALTISVYRGSYEIAEALLARVCSEIPKNKYAIISIEDAVILLNHSGNSHLPSLYDNFLRASDDPALPKFCEGGKKFPIYFESDVNRINPENFMTSEAMQNEGELILFKESLVKFNVHSGSKWSLEFLTSLMECPNQDIFRSQYIQSLLIYKWKHLRYYMYAQSIIYLLYMLILCYQILAGSYDGVTIMTIFMINFLLLVFEIFQMKVTGARYWTDFWNYLDIIRSITCMVYYGMIFLEIPATWSHEVLGVVTLTSWIRGIAYFRIFQKTRYIINLLTEVINDMKAFLSLLVYSTLSFSFLFMVISHKDDFNEFLIGNYKLNLGDVEASYQKNTIEFILLTVAVIINPIIMLNLLISIIGDTFDRVQSIMVIADMKELCEMITEIESLLYWRRGQGMKKYLQICNSRLCEEQKEESWEGKIRVLDVKLIDILDEIKKVSANTEQIVKNQENQKANIEEILKKIKTNEPAESSKE